MSPDPRWAAWQPFIETSAQIQTLLDEDLRRRHGIALADYQVLLLLSHAPQNRLRMGEIADAMVFSASRLSYQIDKLGRAAENLGKRAAIGRDDRHACGERLDRGQAEPLVERGQHERGEVLPLH